MTVFEIELYIVKTLLYASTIYSYLENEYYHNYVSMKTNICD